MFERLAARTASYLFEVPLQHLLARVGAIGILLAGSAANVSATPARVGYSKALLSKQSLFALPNASAPARIDLFAGLDAAIVEDYERTTLLAVRESEIDTLRARSQNARIQVNVRDDFDHVFINGRRIDTRLGTAASVPSERLDPAYTTDEWSSWLVQFHGPVKTTWLEEAKSRGVVFVQYVPYHAFIAAARASTIRQLSELPAVQFIEQLHTFMKPSASASSRQVATIWIQVAETPETEETIAMLRILAVDGIKHDAWSEVERRVEGRFRPEHLEIILRDPLVIAVTQRPAIELSDERVSLSLTDLAPGTAPGRYKKWLGDLCEVCGNLAGDNHFLGIADTGLDGGTHEAPPSGQNPGEVGASGDHRSELDYDPPPASSRIVYGSTFAPVVGPLSEYPDSTGTRHDVHGHGTWIAGIAAGDPPLPGASDPDGFLWGIGVAPTAGVVMTKIDVFNIGTSTSQPVRDVARDALLRNAHIQNHSYNQYVRPDSIGCATRFDGFYSSLSRDFDIAARDADAAAAGKQEMLFTVSAGNIDQQPAPSPPNPSCPDRSRILPPATAKNVLAIGMAENVRPWSGAWNCKAALANSFDNVATNGKTGTATSGWFKPDLMAAATNVALTASHDLDRLGRDFCGNRTGSQPPVPDEFNGTTGTSFAAPAAAGAALLARRFYASHKAPHEPHASPALLKAMLIAGSVSMRGGHDRTGVRAWLPATSGFKEGDLAVPRAAPNNHHYQALNDGYTGTSEPTWLTTPAGVEFWDTHPENPVKWKHMGAEVAVEGFPNSKQGFGRLNLADVITSFPARDFVNQTDSLQTNGADWTRTYRVHDPSRPVRVALVWTDAPKAVADGSYVTGSPLVNDLNLSVQVGAPCTKQFFGNRLSSTEESIPDFTCADYLFDFLNNVEVVRFSGAVGSLFTVRVSPVNVVGTQDFALAVVNAYRDGLPPPPDTPAAVTAMATSTTQVQIIWTASPGAAEYDSSAARVFRTHS